MKKHFLTGLALLLPAVLTFVTIAFFVNFFTTPFAPLIADFLRGLENQLGFILPESVDWLLAKGIALFLVLLFVLLLGVVARLYLVRHLLHLVQALFSKIPILSTVFQISKELFSSLLSDNKKKAFERPVLFPFAGPKNFSLGFLAGEVPSECQSKVSEELVSVFSPTAPHPISGFLFLLPKKDVIDVAFSNEEAFKFLVSCGIVLPEGKNNA